MFHRQDEVTFLSKVWLTRLKKHFFTNNVLQTFCNSFCLKRSLIIVCSLEVVGANNNWDQDGYLELGNKLRLRTNKDGIGPKNKTGFLKIYWFSQRLTIRKNVSWIFKFAKPCPVKWQ